MGFCKYLAEKFKCGSECTFNIEDIPEDLFNLDLGMYQLKPKDIKVIHNIMKKRPSKMNYVHKRNSGINVNLKEHINNIEV